MEVNITSNEAKRIRILDEMGKHAQSIKEKLEIMDEQEALARSMLKSGWTLRTLAAHRLGTTPKHFSELVDEGIYSLYYGASFLLLDKINNADLQRTMH